MDFILKKITKGILKKNGDMFCKECNSLQYQVVFNNTLALKPIYDFLQLKNGIIQKNSFENTIKQLKYIDTILDIDSNKLFKCINIYDIEMDDLKKLSNYFNRNGILWQSCDMFETLCYKYFSERNIGDISLQLDPLCRVSYSDCDLTSKNKFKDIFDTNVNEFFDVFEMQKMLRNQYIFEKIDSMSKLKLF